MYKVIFSSLIFMCALGTIGFAQPYVVNEKIEKVFSEGFTDPNDHFETTPNNDSKFWGAYADGYYYMERRIPSARAIVVNAEGVSKNFYIKTKIMLGPDGGNDASSGVMYLLQSGGRGGFLFEFNKKKSFRIQDLGTGAYITKEGEDGWLKAKSLAPATRNNTIEIKGFRGKFDIYVNSEYIYSYINSSYEKGKFGTYLGPKAAARLFYFNVYELDIPGAEPEINLNALMSQIEELKEENDSLKTQALISQYGDSNMGAIAAIKVLEEQLKAVNEENTHIKKILKDYEENEPAIAPEVAEDQQKESELMVEKIAKLSAERDSISDQLGQLKNKLFKVSFQRDSLRDINLDLMKKMDYLENHMKEVEAAINKIQNEDNKEPSTPSTVATLPTPPVVETTATVDTINATEILDKDSTYDHTINIDEEVGITEDVPLVDTEEKEEPKAELLPLRKQKIKVKKAKKAEFKD